MLPADLELIRTIADELPVGVWVARVPGGELLYANRAFGDILGMNARDDVAAGGYSTPYGIHDRTGALYPEDRLPFARAVRERTVVTVDDLVIHRHDGKKAYVRAFGKPLFDAGGEIGSVAIAFIDITREVEAERSLRQAQRMESIGKLAGGVAHDFNNLLTPIALISAGLLAREQDPLRREQLTVIRDVAERAIALTHSLLGFAGQGKHLSQRVSMVRVVGQLSDLVRRTFDRRIEIAVDVAPDTGDVVGDQSQLEQVLMNLLINARDAMPMGGRLSIAARADAGADQVVVEVADTGGGIEPAIRDRIFEPYFTTKTKGPVRGSGLGLAVAYGIVEAHRGTIEVEDAQPGTRMRVRLPRAASSGAAISPAPAGALVRGAGTVLVVDDNPHVLNAVGTTLEELGYQALRAAGGAEAVEIFRDRPGAIDAVVLDMVMPQMDARATYLALRALDPRVRVLLMTGYALNEEAQSILDLGVAGFLPKPCTPERLSAALARVLGR
jgi:PAS domain S-box-containing protein